MEAGSLDEDHLKATAYRIVGHAKKYESRHSCPLTTLLISLDGVMTEKLGSTKNGSSRHWTASVPVSHVVKPTFCRETISNNSSNFLAWTVGHNLVKFVKATLDASPQQIGKSGRPLLDFALYPTFLEHGFWHASRDTGYFEDMVKLLLERGASPNERVDSCGSMSVWQLFLFDNHACEFDMEDEWQPRASAWEVAQLLLRHKADPQAEIPLKYSQCRASAEHNLHKYGQDASVQRRCTSSKSVEHCLSCIERHELVPEVLSILPVQSNDGFWSSWKPWFL
jgi:hypothetical protein